ncbi:hypothetical protein D3C80_1921070 [compost metagenome]
MVYRGGGDALGVSGPSCSVDGAVRSGANTRFWHAANAVADLAPAGLTHHFAVAFGDIYQSAKGHVAGVYCERSGANDRGRTGQ